MELLVSLLIMALIIMIVIYVIDLLPLPDNIKLIAKLIVGLVFLLRLLTMLGIGTGRFVL